MVRYFIISILLSTSACKGSEQPPPGAASGSGSATASEAQREKSIKADLIGTDPGKLAFETKPLLGMTVAELKAEYGKYKFDPLGPGPGGMPQMFTIPGGNAFPRVVPRLRNLDVHVEWMEGKIASYWTSTDHALRAEIIAALTAARGAPTPTGNLDQEGMAFGTSPQTIVTTERSGGFLKLLVRR